MKRERERRRKDTERGETKARRDTDKMKREER